jgi:hypothetical protein
MKGCFMRKLGIFTSVVGLCAATAAGTYYYVSKSAVPLVISNSVAIAAAEKYAAQEEADLRLGQYAINAMYKAGAKDKISDAKKQVLARAIVRVSNDIFTKEEEKKAFISIIAIESAFQRFVQSPTGPKGYSQIAKKSFTEAMDACGVTNLHEEDVWETDLNLYAGACYFRKQLDANGGDQYMAMIAYNQGPASDSLKSYAKSGNMDNIEVLKYMAKFTFLKRTLTDTKIPNVPSINELPKPASPNKTK